MHLNFLGSSSSTNAQSQSATPVIISAQKDCAIEPFIQTGLSFSLVEPLWFHDVCRYIKEVCTVQHAQISKGQGVFNNQAAGVSDHHHHARVKVTRREQTRRRRQVHLRTCARHCWWMSHSGLIYGSEAAQLAFRGPVSSTKLISLMLFADFYSCLF